MSSGMDFFSWLSSDKGNFNWWFSTIKESHRAKAKVWWNAGCRAVLSIVFTNDAK